MPRERFARLIGADDQRFVVFAAEQPGPQFLADQAHEGPQATQHQNRQSPVEQQGPQRDVIVVRHLVVERHDDHRGQRRRTQERRQVGKRDVMKRAVAVPRGVEDDQLHHQHRR